MPTNRRKLNRKHHALAEAEAWETFMLLGTDWFGDLHRAGLSPEDIECEAPHVWRRQCRAVHGYLDSSPRDAIA